MRRPDSSAVLVVWNVKIIEAHRPPLPPQSLYDLLRDVKTECTVDVWKLSSFIKLQQKETKVAVMDILKEKELVK